MPWWPRFGTAGDLARPAPRRGAPLLAEVVGYGETADAHHLMSMQPEGGQIRRAARTGVGVEALEGGQEAGGVFLPLGIPNGRQFEHL